MKDFTIKDVVRKFDLKILYKNKDINLNERKIIIPGINRGGFQLMGYESKRLSLLRRVVLLSSTESEYFDTLNSDDFESHFSNILKDYIPAVFVTPKFSYSEELCEVARKIGSKVPVIQFFADSSEFANTVNLYIAECLAPTTRVHGTLVNIFGYGVLITGPSEIGKSETALDLIRNGHLFIGDDSIDILKINNKIIGRCSDLVKNFIEIRGIGILDVTKMYGYHVVMSESQIQLVIKLVGTNSHSLNKLDRLGTSLKYQQYFNVKIPAIKIPVIPGRNLADLIISAVISLKLKEAGQDSAIQFEQEVLESLKSGD